MVIELLESGRSTNPTELVFDLSGSRGFAPKAAARGSLARNCNVCPGERMLMPLLLKVPVYAVLCWSISARLGA